MTDPLRPAPTRNRPSRPTPAQLAMAAAATALTLGTVGVAAAAEHRPPARPVGPVVTTTGAAAPHPAATIPARLVLQTGCPAQLRLHQPPEPPAATAP